MRYVAICFSLALLQTTASAATAMSCGPDNPSRELPGNEPNGKTMLEAMSAARQHDVSRAIRLYRAIDEMGEQPALSLPSDHPWHAVILRKHFSSLAAARRRIGIYYETGTELPQDFKAAAQWYQKAVNTPNCNNSKVGDEDATSRLARLYYYGKGVAQDRQKAVLLWATLDERSNSFLVLAKNDALPPTYESWGQFNFAQAKETISARIRQAQEAAAKEAEQKRETYLALIKADPTAVHLRCRGNQGDQTFVTLSEVLKGALVENLQGPATLFMGGFRGFLDGHDYSDEAQFGDDDISFVEAVDGQVSVRMSINRTTLFMQVFGTAFGFIPLNESSECEVVKSRRRI